MNEGFININSMLQTSCITITFGEQVENHVGMQKIGKLAYQGFTPKNLKKAKKRFESVCYECKLIDLNQYLPVDIESNEEAYVLIIKNGIEIFTQGNLLEEDLMKLDWDTKAFMRGRVVNKKARHNLCFGEIDQEPDYENGKGRIISIDKISGLVDIREGLSEYLGKKANSLLAEGNLYYDTKKCGIGFHGDTERKIVVAIRLGKKIPMYYQWYQNSKPIGDKISLDIDGGDMYVMSEKATGCDWKKRLIPTLRHAAGCEAFTTIKK